MKGEDGKCAAHGKLYTALPIVSLATKNYNFRVWYDNNEDDFICEKQWQKKRRLVP